MSYDEVLADRIRAALATETAIEERQMMGGLAFLKNGNMLGGVDGARLFVRVGPQRREEALQQPHVGLMRLGARDLKGFVVVDPEAIATESTMQAWLAQGLAVATAQPPKRR